MNLPRRLSRRAPAIVLGLSAATFVAAACAIPASQASSRNAPVRCELILDETRGATTIEGRVSADRPVSGSYRLSITSSGAGGQASISQSGDFQAGPDRAAVLGTTTLAGTPARHRAELELTLPGESLRCGPQRHL